MMRGEGEGERWGERVKAERSQNYQISKGVSFTSCAAKMPRNPMQEGCSGL